MATRSKASWSERKAEDPAWTEADSATFLDDARFFVPAREAQIETTVAALPDLESRFGAQTAIADLCSGQGLLARALLERFPRATVHLWDGSEAMLEHARTDLARFGARVSVHRFDLADPDWTRALPRPLHGIVSSLALHHLDGLEMKALYRRLWAALEPGGAIAIADLVEPATAESKAIAARAWDEAVRERSLALGGDLAAWERFQATGWNLWAQTEPDPIDKPSPLTAHLDGMREAGFAAVDVHWLVAGHAIWSGRKEAGTA